MRVLRRFTLVAVLCAGVMPAAAARAQAPVTMAPSAAELERDARQAFARKEFVVAARGFEAAYRAAPLAALEINAAVAWEQAGDPGRAADAYETALSSSGIDAELTKQTRARLARLEQSLGTLSVEGPAGASARIDGEPAGALPLHVHLLQGDHVIEISRAGVTEQQRVSVKAGQARTVKFSAPDPSPSPAPPPLPPSLPASPSSSLRTGGWVAIGVAGAATAAAVGLGVTTLSAIDTFKAANDTSTSLATRNDLHDHAVLLRALTNVAAFAAVAAGGAGITLVAVGSRSSSAPPAAVRIGPTGASVRLSF